MKSFLAALAFTAAAAQIIPDPSDLTQSIYPRIINTDALADASSNNSAYSTQIQLATYQDEDNWDYYKNILN
jgi:hypothetical protein